jgi:transposase
VRDSSIEGQQTCGLDLGDRFSSFCIVDSAGKVVEEGRVSTTPEMLRRRFGACPPMRVALEVGTHSPWVSRLLAEYGHEVIVANPAKLRMIYRSDSKSDRVDARWLAKLARVDPALLAPIQHRGPEAQTDLAVIRARDGLVRSRTNLINHVRGAVKATGGRLPNCSAQSFAKRACGVLPEALVQALEPGANGEDDRRLDGRDS